MSEILFWAVAAACTWVRKLWEAMQPYPLGALYAASYFARPRAPRSPCSVRCWPAPDPSGLRHWTATPSLAVLLKTTSIACSKMCLLRMREAAFTMLGMARERGCTVIACGADATDHAPEYLEHGAQFILTGEGEVTLGELVDTIQGQPGNQPGAAGSLEAIQGLVFTE